MSQLPPWSPGQPSPAGQPYLPSGPGPSYGYGPWPAAAVRTSVKGPRAMTVVGAVLLVLAVALVALSVPTIVSMVPTHVVDGAGNPGSAAVTALQAPGTTPVRLEPGYYDVFLASTGLLADLNGSVTVAAADGSPVSVSDPTVTTSYTVLDRNVVSVASFHISRAGQYQVSAPQVSPQTAHVILGHGKDPKTVATAGLELLAAVLVGVAGFGLTLGGGLWWGARARNRRRLAAWQATPPAGYRNGTGPSPW